MRALDIERLDERIVCRLSGPKRYEGRSQAVRQGGSFTLESVAGFVWNTQSRGNGHSHGLLLALNFLPDRDHRLKKCAKDNLRYRRSTVIFGTNGSPSLKNLSELEDRPPFEGKSKQTRIR